MRVQVFEASSAGQLQEGVTAWLAANPGITIMTAVQSMGAVQPRPGDASGTAIILTVFYDEAAAAADRSAPRPPTAPPAD